MRKPRIHFISGLPRSGSTLLAAILRQNPAFHAGISSPVAAAFGSLLGTFSAGSEFSSLVDADARERLLSGLFTSYYSPQIEAGKIIFDTNRAWCSRLPDMLRLFPDARLIACVRNVAWVLDSLERKFRDSAFENTRFFGNDAERGTVFSRVDTLAQRDRMVGYAWAATKEAYFSEQASAMLVVDFDLLVRSPAKVMELIYQFVDLPAFTHDYENVYFAADDFDREIGVDGLHRVSQRVEPRVRRSILPPELFEQYSALSFWKDQTGSAAHVIRLKL